MKIDPHVSHEHRMLAVTPTMKLNTHANQQIKESFKISKIKMCMVCYSKLLLMRQIAGWEKTRYILPFRNEWYGVCRKNGN